MRIKVKSVNCMIARISLWSKSFRKSFPLVAFYTLLEAGFFDTSSNDTQDLLWQKTLVVVFRNGKWLL